jgi:hypothetical protein
MLAEHALCLLHYLDTNEYVIRIKGGDRKDANASAGQWTKDG